VGLAVLAVLLVWTGALIRGGFHLPGSGGRPPSSADGSGASAGATPTAPTVPKPVMSPPAGVSGPAGITGNWSYVAGDEFNGTGLDRSKWCPGWFAPDDSGPVNSFEDHPYRAANVTEPGDGSLHLALTSDAAALVSSNPLDKCNAWGFQWDGPAVMEARVYLPGEGGKINDWPAVWSDGQSWPRNGEIDVVEGLHGEACYHVHTTAGGPGACDRGDLTGWHTFASYWNGRTVTFYYDGERVGSAPYTATGEQYAVLDYTSSSVMGGPEAAPATMDVDWVRVWKPSTGPAASGSPAPPPTPSATTATPATAPVR